MEDKKQKVTWRVILLTDQKAWHGSFETDNSSQFMIDLKLAAMAFYTNISETIKDMHDRAEGN